MSNKRPNDEEPNGDKHDEDLGQNNKRPRRRSPSPGPSSGATSGGSDSDAVKRYHCKLCENDVSFTSKDNLIRHLVTHAGEQPYKCRPCGFGTTRHDYYSRHLQTHKHRMSKKKAGDHAKAAALRYLKANKKGKQTLNEIPASKLHGAVRKAILEKHNLLPQPEDLEPPRDVIRPEAIEQAGISAAVASTSSSSLNGVLNLDSHNEGESEPELSLSKITVDMESQTNENGDFVNTPEQGDLFASASTSERHAAEETMHFYKVAPIPNEANVSFSSRNEEPGDENMIAQNTLELRQRDLGGLRQHIEGNGVEMILRGNVRELIVQNADTSGGESAVMATIVVCVLIMALEVLWILLG